MSYSFAFTLHLIAAVVWVGGMFFAHMILRPSAVEKLDPPQRLPLWAAVFGRFFFWVWISVAAILITGYWMMFFWLGFDLAMQMKHVSIMHITGLVMVAIYTFIFFGPYQKFKAAVDAQQFPVAGEQINKIRQLVTTNLVLGLITIVIASGGKYINL